MLRLGIYEYDECMKRKTEHIAFYNREIALYWHHHLDYSFYSWNMDRELLPMFKENWCKRSPPKLLRSKYLNNII